MVGGPESGVRPVGVEIEFDVSMWPKRMPYRHLADIVDLDAAPQLSARATAGFLNRAERSTLNFADGFIAAPLTDAQLADYMRAKSAADILAVAPSMPAIFTDGQVIPTEGIAPLFNGSYANKVPLIIGTNHDEYKLWTAFRNPFPGASAELLDAIGRYASDIWRVAGAIATSFAKNDSQPPIYVYRFNWGAINADGLSPLPVPYDESLGAHHALEIPFVLGNIDF